MITKHLKHISTHFSRLILLLVLFGVLLSFTSVSQTSYFKIVGGIPHLPVFANTNAVSSPITGMIVYSTEDENPMIYNGSSWNRLCDEQPITGSSSSFFRIERGIPILPVKAEASGTRPPGGMFYSTSHKSIMILGEAGNPRRPRDMKNDAFPSNQHFKSFGGDDKTVFFPVLNADPTGTITTGAIYVNSSSKAIRYYNGTEWKPVSCSFNCGEILTVTHTEGEIAPETKTISYETGLVTTNGKPQCWLMRNLGADQQAKSFDDNSKEARGWIWQFNRKQGYIEDIKEKYDKEKSCWLAQNDPCRLLLGPEWRLPTNKEWSSFDEWETDNTQGYNILKLTATKGYWGLSPFLDPQGAGYYSREEIAFGFCSSCGYHDYFDKNEGMPIRCVIGENAAPDVAPTISYTSLVVGETVSLSYMYYDYEEDPEDHVNIQWYCDYDNPISGATSVNYTLRPSDVGKSLYAKVTPYARTGTITGQETAVWAGIVTSGTNLTVTTYNASNITTTTASSGGSVSSVNGTATQKGVCYNTTGNPTITTGTVINSGSGNTSFISNLTGLSPATKYYLRAFATGSDGTTYYGSQVSFTTADLFTITTTPASSVTFSSLTTGGTITANSGSTATDKGICYSSTNSTPTKVNSTYISAESGNSTFTLTLTGLSSNTTYYVRAYASNANGTSYGNIISVTTLANPCPSATITDIDGNTYNTLIIGNQCWMTSNLKTTKFRDNTTLSNRTSITDWTTFSSSSYCWLNNDINNKARHGALYNKSAAYSGRLCPSGWRIPTESDFAQLTTTLGGASNAGRAMQITEPSGNPGQGWYGQGTNTSGFSAYQSGFRQGSYGFNSGYYPHEAAIFWVYKNDISSTTQDIGTTHFSLWADDNSASTQDVADDNWGLSVRCIAGGQNIPIVITTPIANYTGTSATFGGTVDASSASSAIVEKGICWGSSKTPTISNNKTILASGINTITINTLVLGTIYHVRAYATDATGKTYYGDDLCTSEIPFSCGNALIVNYTAGDIAPETKTIAYHTVVSNLTGTTKCWITQNLGAEQQATSATDASDASAGWYWQFNRKQGFIPSGSNDVIPSAKWLAQFYEEPNWLPENDPCLLSLGEGWRIPTKIEWENAGQNLNQSTAYSSVLKIHQAGCINSQKQLVGRGSSNEFSSSISYYSDQSYVYHVGYSSSLNGNKNVGTSIRCIKDLSTTIITAPASYVSSTSASISFTVTTDNSSGNNATERGVCYSVRKNPTLRDKKSTDYYVSYNSSGTYSRSLDYLKPGTTYYARAFVRLSTEEVIWGNEISFTTTGNAFVCGNSLTVAHTAGSVAPETTTITYGTVSTNISGATKCWITQNLGATRQASSQTDGGDDAAGWYWVFDNCQGIKYTTSTQNTTPSYANVKPGGYIYNLSWDPYRDPCYLLLGDGWRLPTNTEWGNVIQNDNWGYITRPWQSVLKVHFAGIISYQGAKRVYDRGTDAYLWSSNLWDSSGGGGSACTNGSKHPNSVSGFFQTYDALPVRCLKD